MHAGADRNDRATSRTSLLATGLLFISWLTFGLPPKTAPAATLTPVLILGYTPAVGSNVPLAEPFTVYFNQSMNRASVERAWRVVPTVPGHFAWAGTAMTFRPAGSLKPATYYRMSIGIGAESTTGAPLEHTFHAAFSTANSLKVQSFSPAPGTNGVSLNSVIAVTFNHPMVALGGLSQGTSNPGGWSVAISPTTAGVGSWLGTSTWAFHPTRGFLPSSRYTVRLAGSVRDAWGEALGKDLQWSFRTILPEVVSESPPNGSRFINPSGPVEVTFNQPMNRASTERSFSLSSAKSAVRGSTIWQGNTLIFRPAHPLTSSSLYVAHLGSSVRSANSHARLHKSVSWRFRVSPKPSIISTSPGSGRTAYGNQIYDGTRLYMGAQVGIHFTAPMNKKSIDQHLTISPSLSHLQTSIYGPNPRSRFVYTIDGDFSPSTNYTVTLSAGVQDRFARSIPTSYTFSFNVARIAPSISLYGMPGGDSASFSSGRVIDAPIQFVNIPRVHYQLVKTSLQDLINQSGGPLAPPIGPTIRQWTETVDHPLDKVQNQTVRLTQKDGSPLAPGLYWLAAHTDSNIPGWRPYWQEPPASSETVLVTNVNVTMKRGSTGTLVWVNSADTGQPLSGVRVQLLSFQGANLESATTDSNGLHLFPKVTNHANLTAAQVSDKTHFGLTRDYWQPYVSPPDPTPLINAFYPGQVWPAFGPSSNGTYLYTDRPVYRAGQQVHFRAILWRDHDAVYSRPTGKVAQVSAYDGRSHVVYQAKLKLDRVGAVHGQFTLPSSAFTGQGSINISVFNSIFVGTNYSIAEYRKPQFLTSVTTGASRYAQGQTLTATVGVKYFFGAPVIHQSVSWVAYAQPRFSSPPGWDAYSFFNWDELWQQARLTNNTPPDSQFGSRVAHGTGTTDGKGNLSIRWPVDLSKFPEDQTLTLEATTTDASHQQVSGRVAIPIHKSLFAIGLRPDKQVLPVGHQATVEVGAVKQDGTPLGGQYLTATVVRRTYTGRLANVNGSSQWQSIPHDTPVKTVDLTTDAGGKTMVSFTPDQGGEYRVEVGGKDQLGNSVQNAVSIDSSVAGFSDWGASESPAVTLKPDKTSYQVGDTAHVLVTAPFDHATALVTLERRRIRMYRVEHLASNSPTIDLPITLDDLPNIYVTVTLYRGWRNGSPPDWRYGLAELHVRLDPKHLVVHLSQNGKKHRPGDLMTYQVTTTDSTRKPVSAQVSVALVDKSVLALQDESNPDVLSALYSDRPLEVLTASDGSVLADHLTQKPDFQLQPFAQQYYSGLNAGADLPIKAGARTGGGGGCGNPCPGGPAPVRSRFVDTGFWTGALFTNANGKATIHLRLPDNATTWRVDARAVSANMQVGQARMETVTTRDVILRPVIPRFFIQGDQVRLGAVVNNTLSRRVPITVSLKANGVRVATRLKQTASIPAHDERLFEWNAHVPRSSYASLTFIASPGVGGVEGDALRTSVGVHPPLTDETVAAAGQVYDSMKQYVIVPKHAVAQPGSLWVQVSASLTAGLGAAYSEFRPSDHESNEDVANRLLVASSLRSLPQSINGLSPRDNGSLSSTVHAAAQKLLDNQFGDGGWPWFSDGLEESDPTITADVVRALSVSGLHTRSVKLAISQGQRFVFSRIRFASPGDKAHLILVLAKTGKDPRHLSEALYNNSVKRSHLDVSALADLGEALTLAHDPAKGRTVVSDLDSRAIASPTGAHWENSAWTYYSQPAVSTTTEILGALLRLSPHDSLIPAAARWLMLAREGNAWDCPTDTAQAIYQLAQYARAAREGRADYRYQVTVDSRPQISGQYHSSNQNQARVARIPITSLHRTGRSSLLINREAPDGVFGTGPLYFVARLRYYLPANLIAPRDVGVGVQRQYLDSSGHTISSASVGSIVKVRLTLNVPHTLLFLRVDDPIPAGFEPIDETLNTTQQGLFGPYYRPFPLPGQEAVDPSFYTTHSDIRDDHVSIYAPFVPPGKYSYTYLAEASVPGTYGVAPTHASESFFPEVFGRGAGQSFNVK